MAGCGICFTVSTFLVAAHVCHLGVPLLASLPNLFFFPLIHTLLVPTGVIPYGYALLGDGIFGVFMIPLFFGIPPILGRSAAGGTFCHFCSLCHRMRRDGIHQPLCVIWPHCICNFQGIWILEKNRVSYWGFCWKV